MLQTDIRDHCRFGTVNDIGGIELAAHSDLQHHQITVLLGIIEHGDGGDELKLTGVIRHGIRADTNPLGDPSQILSRDVHAVDLYTLTEILNIGGNVQPGPVSCRAQNGIQHGTGGAFAVASGNVDKLQIPLRITQSV